MSTSIQCNVILVLDLFDILLFDILHTKHQGCISVASVQSSAKTAPP